MRIDNPGFKHLVVLGRYYVATPIGIAEKLGQLVGPIDSEGLKLEDPRLRAVLRWYVGLSREQQEAFGAAVVAVAQAMRASERSG